MRYLVQDTNQGRTSREMLLFGQGEFLYLTICIGWIPGPDFGALGLSTPGMGAVPSQIFLQRVHFGLFYVYSIVPHLTTPPIWQMFQVLLVYFDHTHMWKVSGCSNHGPLIVFDVVAAYF
ncbi:hypothetical protein FRACYDRAFT_254667 [Fragilariopsis cylindrus CCMP1102]|uniref:Uncharacterized protein n=1 Tax=Fragilariopsis cylindrus CCMP1102 TaxID=635003 RepID=A0A1E7ELE3_9STRA|nr:hypothetical protein FRACYDRAFT_254667 [Fragilariopsis cylindrus CCMP1102]|eukprot:OEU06383.1 hypothetical protein FRACYDRAFT_254667 [Fragilariopsis cylindrus CCMP1102]